MIKKKVLSGRQEKISDISSPLFQFPPVKPAEKKGSLGEPMGKNTVTIIGFGPIGAHFAEIYRNAGLNIIAATRSEQTAQLFNSKEVQIKYSGEKSFTRTIPNIQGITYSKEQKTDLLNHIINDDRVALTLPEAAYGKADAPSDMIKILAEGIVERYKMEEPLNIDFVINKDGSRDFAVGVINNAVKALIADTDLAGQESNIMKNVTFSNTVENRKSGKISETEFSAEPLFELMAPKGTMTGFTGIIEKDVIGLRLYETMKNRASNGLHAGFAALGFDAGKVSIDEALKDPRLKRLLDGAIEEMIEAVHCETNVPKEEIRSFIMNTVVKGFEEAVGDPVTRVARNPLRKTGKKERILAPILNYMQATGKIPNHLCNMLLAEILYSTPDVRSDKYRGPSEDLELNPGWELLTEIKDGLENFLFKQCGLKPDNQQEVRLIKAMVDIYANSFDKDKAY